MIETDALQLSTPVNLRDLGGTPVAGGTIAAGFAIRSDDLATITDADAERLVAGGMRAVIDLRSREEVEFTGRGPLFQHPVAYHHMPLMQTLAGATQPSAAVAAAAGGKLRSMPSMHDLYVSQFERSARSLVAALAVVAYSEGAVAFHCSAGKDRTGILAAALLLALGADDATIIADYEATYPRLPAIMSRIGSNLLGALKQSGLELDNLEMDGSEVAKDKGAMAAALATLRERYGDPLTPLRAAGLSDALIETLRERALA